MNDVMTYRTGDYYGDGTSRHIWEITDDDGLAAELYVSLGGEIMSIETRDDRRGEGLARTLYDTAALEREIYHAPAGHRTHDGNVFAEAVGGPTAAYECDCYACEPEDFCDAA